MAESCHRNSDLRAACQGASGSYAKRDFSLLMRSFLCTFHLPMDFSQGYEALEQAAMHWEAAGLHPHDEEMQEEDNEDFYGNGMANEDVKPGAAEPVGVSFHHSRIH